MVEGMAFLIALLHCVRLPEEVMSKTESSSQMKSRPLPRAIGHAPFAYRRNSMPGSKCGHDIRVSFGTTETLTRC